MNDRVEMPFEYSAERTPTGVRLNVTREVINFVREVIPDGQMAGLIGHRPVPSTQEFAFELDDRQARYLLDDLGRALGTTS